MAGNRGRRERRLDRIARRRWTGSHGVGGPDRAASVATRAFVPAGRRGGRSALVAARSPLVVIPRQIVDGRGHPSASWFRPRAPGTRFAHEHAGLRANGDAGCRIRRRGAHVRCRSAPGERMTLGWPAWARPGSAARRPDTAWRHHADGRVGRQPRREITASAPCLRDQRGLGGPRCASHPIRARDASSASFTMSHESFLHGWVLNTPNHGAELSFVNNVVGNHTWAPVVSPGFAPSTGARLR
jgi:hypothetical protein